MSIIKKTKTDYLITTGLTNEQKDTINSMLAVDSSLREIERYLTKQQDNKVRIKDKVHCSSSLVI